ncbi:hypothetical protein WG936_06000 [Corynebacterium sp. H127]|uniref:hypothetical protein n=1 Tax=Corynebacterium sp. H127 TaxID=3133418 RepID=UPI003099DB94
MELSPVVVEYGKKVTEEAVIEWLKKHEDRIPSLMVRLLKEDPFYEFRLKQTVARLNSTFEKMDKAKDRRYKRKLNGSP